MKIDLSSESKHLIYEEGAEKGRKEGKNERRNEGMCMLLNNNVPSIKQPLQYTIN